MSWFKAIRTPEALTLLAVSRNAFAVAYLIALRARRSKEEIARPGCEVGEAIVSDHAVIGLSRQEFRTARQILENNKIATFRATNKQTYGKLANSRLFDTSLAQEQPSKQPANNQQTTSKQPAEPPPELVLPGFDPPPPPPPKKQKLYPDARNILAYLNEKTGNAFREVDATLILINSRLIEPGVTLQGVREMINHMVAAWKGTELEAYLRPTTLFGKQKFDNYYAQRLNPVRRPGSGPPKESTIVRDLKRSISQDTLL